jgi:hypothetical protein
MIASHALQDAMTEHTSRRSPGTNRFHSGYGARPIASTGAIRASVELID